MRVRSDPFLVFIVGVLAAIAIPNFIRYQLRAKASEATANLALIARVEQAEHARASRYLAFTLPRGTPGPSRMGWTPDEKALAARMGWPAGGATYFTYRVEVGATPDGKQAYSACAEADLDGDGAFEAIVVWQPVVDAAGQVVALPPDPPCTHEPVTDRSARYELRDPTGTPSRSRRTPCFDGHPMRDVAAGRADR